MPKFLAYAAFGLMVFGCSPATPDSNTNTSTTPTDTNTASTNTATSTSNNDAASTNNTPTSDTGGTVSTTGTSGSTFQKNPDRIFQLDKLEKTTIKTKGGDLVLWVMDTEDKRREGMMFLTDKEVKDNEGMIFVFPKVQEVKGNYAFWMHNTILPLDIDYISKDKKVINVGKGRAMNDDPVKPQGDYFYVIEVKQGLSARFGLTPGAKVDISSNLKGLP